MDLMAAIKIWAECDGKSDCGICPLYDPDPEVFSVCNLLSEAWQELESKKIVSLLYLN